jgi:hypothetical protein
MGTIMDSLAQGVVQRNLEQEGQALLDKWEKTGLLEGIGDDHSRKGMALLLENQTKELLREASTMAAGDVEGFASVAFPIVRRVFGGLIANELVSVQPMSLPSGLIFFLDFTFTDTKLMAGALAGESIYGQDRVGAGIIDGVNIEGGVGGYGDELWNLEKGFYSLNNAYSAATGTVALSTTTVLSGAIGDGDATSLNTTPKFETLDAMVGYDPDMIGLNVAFGIFPTSSIETGTGKMNFKNLVAFHAPYGSGSMVRRHTNYFIDHDQADGHYIAVALVATGSESTNELSGALTGSVTFSYAYADNFEEGTGLGAIKGTTLWPLENETEIPEIDIKIDSTAITAMTKKLKAKWTPELGQDLNAYHNLDAEVELTSILSEQIALEIDQEILNDLVKGATAGTYYWSRRPGRFVDRLTGELINVLEQGDFTGTVSQWYETMLETVNDISAQIQRKVLRGGANFLVCGPELANVLEMTSGFRATVTGDEAKGTAGVFKSGAINKKWDIYVDPYFPRNVVLVGRKGGSFLESGYVYSPYVPLQVTPTIFGIEDFVPRKGVMTRYAKKMVRPDMYGILIVRDLMG